MTNPKLKINILALNAKSGAGKDYIVSNFNFINQVESNFYNTIWVQGKSYIPDHIRELTSLGIDSIINNPEKNEFILKKLHEVSSSEISTDVGISWLRSDLSIHRFSTPLRAIVQAVGGTDFTPEEMDSQETKKYRPDHLGEKFDYRDLHLLLSDAVKTAIQRPDIFSVLLELRVIKKIKELYQLIPPVAVTPTQKYTIIVLDMRYPEELGAVNNIRDEFQFNDDIEINLKKVHIKSESFNAINHSSEQDLFGQLPHEFDKAIQNDKNRTTAETLAFVKKELYELFQ